VNLTEIFSVANLASVNNINSLSLCVTGAPWLQTTLDPKRLFTLDLKCRMLDLAVMDQDWKSRIVRLDKTLDLTALSHLQGLIPLAGEAELLRVGSITHC
jgi:hypothetical protein